MGRSTHSERAQRLNAAFDLVATGYALDEAADALIKTFGLSRRQAYRYLQEAQGLKRPVDVPEPIIPFTIKMPESMVTQLRSYAQTSGLTIGETVTRAVRAMLTKARWRG